MIFVFTGAPGAGKTLSALDMLRSDKQFNICTEDNPEGRELFVYGVPDLALPHTPLEDPTKWSECPDGSVIFIDEAWEHFGVRGASVPVPEHVKLLATHRHRGFDIVFATQAIQDLDVFLRRRVNRYYLLQRPGNLPYVKRIHYEGVPDKENKLRPVANEKWFYPTDLYEYYTSTTKNTHKVRMPPGTYIKFGLLILAPLLIAGLLYFAYHAVMNGNEDGVEPTGPTDFDTNEARPNNLFDPSHFETWADWFVPLDFRHPASAPFFADVVAAKNPPVIMCVYDVDANRCLCMTEQHTQIDIDSASCIEYATTGYYQPWLDSTFNTPPRQRGESD